MNRFMQFASAVFTVALVLLILAQCLTAKADTLADRVAEVMNLPPLETVPPIVSMSKCNGHWGETDGKVIRVCDRVPEACVVRVVVHEIAHLLIAKHRGADPEAEALARAAEEAIEPDSYKPNCRSH